MRHSLQWLGCAASDATPLKEWPRRFTSEKSCSDCQTGFRETRRLGNSARLGPPSPRLTQAQRPCREPGQAGEKVFCLPSRPDCCPLPNPTLATEVGRNFIRAISARERVPVSSLARAKFRRASGLSFLALESTVADFHPLLSISNVSDLSVKILSPSP